MLFDNVLDYTAYTSEEVTKALEKNRLLLPVGTIEQHGPHLPLSVDVDIPTEITKKLAHQIGGIIAPAIVYGARSQPHSGGGPSFPGTIYVRGDVLINYFSDIIKSYATSGVSQILIINGHYENEPFIFEALEMCRENGYLEKVSVIALSWWSVIDDGIIKDLIGPGFAGWHAEHAGTVETSLMMYLRPELVRDVRIDHSFPPLAGTYLHPINAKAISTRGVLTKSKNSSSEIGKALFDHICRKLIDLIQNPHGLSSQ